MKKFFRILLILILAGLFVWTLYFLYQKSEEDPVVYETTTAQVTDIVKKTVATGSILPRKEIEIKPQVSGIVQEIYVEPGKEVEKGDLIAKVEIIPDMISLNNAENRLKRAQLGFDNAKQDYTRNKNLFEKGVISASEWQRFQLDFDNAKEELNAAESNLQIIREGASKKQGSNSNNIIRSTVKGMVLDVPVEEGNSVIEANNFNDGTTVASIADMNEMIFEGKVDESEVGKLKEGMDLVLSIGAIEGAVFDAKLEYISPKGIEENGAIQFEIKAMVNLKEDYFIRAGYSANADIVLAKAESVLSIEESLVQFEDGKPFVEVETGEDTFEKRFVELGLSDGIQVEVKSGLSSSDQIKKPI